MNNIFKLAKSNHIKLDDNYSLSSDKYKGIVLTFSEPRVKEKKDGKEENYTFEESRYFPKLNQALERYVELSQTTPSKTIEEILTTCKKIDKVLEDFKKFKNW